MVDAPGWMLVFRGVAAVLFGVLALLAPEFTLLFLVVLCAAYALTGGLSSLRSHVPGSRNGATPALAAGPGRQRWSRCWHDDPALVGNAGNGQRCAPGWVLFGGILLFSPSPRVEAFLSGGICVGPRWAGGVCPGRTAPVFSRVGIVALAWCAGIYALLSGEVFLVLAFRLHRQMKPSGHRSVPEEAHERVRQEAIQAQVSSDPQRLGKHASGRSERDA